jgi:hypothetical protein
MPVQGLMLSSNLFTQLIPIELKGAYIGVCQVLPICQLFYFLGYPLGKPSTLHVDNAAVAAIIAADKMTPRC